MIFHTYPLDPHQIQLQILHLTYLSFQHHHYHSYPYLHPLNILLIQNVDELFRLGTSFPSPRGTQFPAHLVSIDFVHVWKALLVFMRVYLDKDLKVHSLRTERLGGSKLMSIQLEIFSIFVQLWYFFRNMSFCSLITFI